MPKSESAYTDYLADTLKTMSESGVLLVATDASGRTNTMAIGWGLVGYIWGKPMFIVPVRPSRYTHQFMDGGDFTVNVMPAEMKDVVTYCGTVSGRSHDKFAEKGLRLAPGWTVKTPSIEQAVIVYECKTVHRNEVIPANLTEEITASAYPEGDFHTLFFGEITAVYAEEDARGRL
jgi:flavin reductase (DIM6/NTAB) family NADH-FMN oxidoreductase RutF